MFRFVRSFATRIVNEKIPFPQINLIAADGQNQGIKSLQEALGSFDRQKFELQLMSEHNGTAFCRIMPLGGKPKPEKQAPKPVESTKELEINSTIDPHDLGIKLKKAEKFLQKGIRVQFTLTFRAGGKNNMELYESITQELQDLGTPVPGLQKGRKLSFAIKPKSKK